jgi:hypothetical protein
VTTLVALTLPRPLPQAGGEIRSCIIHTLSLEASTVAPVVELVDALDSKSCSERSAGSSPAWGTNLLHLVGANPDSF